MSCSMNAPVMVDAGDLSDPLDVSAAHRALIWGGTLKSMSAAAAAAAVTCTRWPGCFCSLLSAVLGQPYIGGCAPL